MIVPVLHLLHILFQSHWHSWFSLNIFLEHSHLRDLVYFVLFPATMHGFIAAWFVSSLLSQVSHHHLSGIPFLTASLTVGSPIPQHIIWPSLLCFIHNSYHHLTCWYTIHFVFLVYLCVRMQAPWGLMFLSVLSRAEKMSALLLVVDAQ